MKTEPLRLMCVFGTRPEAIKMAPLVLASRARRNIRVINCATGQHREMLEQVTSYFGISPDLNLDLMQPGQSLTQLTSRCLTALDEAVHLTKPDCIVGQGDTTSAMCGSMVAFYHNLPFVHVEAGLRTKDIRSPFPEEFNRRVCSLISSLHCAPTALAAQNLLTEGHLPETVTVTGNTVIDALKWTLERERAAPVRWLEKYADIVGRPMVLITAHRRENQGEGIRSLCRAIQTLATRFPSVNFVYPIHLSPAVQQPVRELLCNIDNVHLIAPAEYPEFVWLMDQATLIVSDSGGVQEEAPTLRTPVLVIRDSTERPEAVDAGATRLIGTAERSIVDEVSRLLLDKAAYADMQVDQNPYGDGNASEIILDLIEQRHGIERQQPVRTRVRELVGSLRHS